MQNFKFLKVVCIKFNLMSSSITLETLKNLFKLPATSCKYQRFVFPIVGLFCNSIFKMKIGFHFYDVPLQGVEVHLLYTHML